jgi:PAS domain S-box-containing protein
MDWLRQLLSSGDFTPHGYSYLWNSGLVWINAISDALIAVAYLAIAVALVWFARKRHDLPFSWVFFLFGTYTVARGALHIIEIWDLWHAQYWLVGVIKAITAAASLVAAFLLIRLIPDALDLPSIGQWMQANAALQKEIRERKELELNLRISEQRYRENAELLELTHDAIFVKRLNNKIVFWNRAAERLYGWSKEEVRGKQTYDLLQTVFPKPMAEIEADLFEKGIWEGELVHCRRDDSKVTVSSRWVLQRDVSGEPTGILETNRDVTQRRKAEELFRHLLESAPDAVVIVNGAGQIQLVNAQTEKFFGYSREEMLGQPVEMLMPKRFASDHVADRTHYSKSPVPRPMGAGLALFGRRKDGTEFPVEISLSPLETEEGTLISSAIRDVTDRQRAEEALRDSEERLKLTLESAQVGTWDWDMISDRAIRSLRHDQIFGYSSPIPEWGLKEFMTVVLPEDAETVNACLEEANVTGNLSIECRVRWPDESVHWVLIRGRVYRGQHGKPEWMRGVITEVTDRKQAEALQEQQRIELARSNAELAALNKELESFSYSVSHDLRAPLRHIGGFAQILKDDHSQELSGETMRLVDRIIHSAHHMGSLVDDLLNLARIGRQNLTLRKTKLDDVVRHAMEELHAEAEKRKIEWRIEPLPEMVCDKGLLKLVFTNLLSNAVKFTRKREGPVIEVGVTISDGLPAIFVRDNGAGFDPKYADKLFGAFQRLHRQEDFEGTGIGLATVQRIIHRHAGRIWAESQPGCGATFYFTLGPGPGSTFPARVNEVLNAK